MGSSIEEINDKAAWKAYAEEFEILKKEAQKKLNAIDEKYKEANAKRIRGLDGDPGSKEHKEIMYWIDQEIKRLQKKHGIIT